MAGFSVRWPGGCSRQGHAPRRTGRPGALAAYPNLGSAGEYLFTGQLYHNAPIYKRTLGGYTWNLYKRANGNWHVDYNTLSEDWDGTIAYTSSATSLPWTASWSTTTVVNWMERAS